MSRSSSSGSNRRSSPRKNAGHVRRSMAVAITRGACSNTPHGNTSGPFIVSADTIIRRGCCREGSTLAVVIVEDLAINDHRLDLQRVAVPRRDRLLRQFRRDALPALTNCKKTSVWDNHVRHVSPPTPVNGHRIHDLPAARTEVPARDVAPRSAR